MRSVTVRLEDLKTMVLNLGFVGENEHTRVTVDCKKLYDQYPNASAALTVQPPEGEAYPAVIERDGDSVIWDVTDSDLLCEGTGQLQLSFTAEPHVAKSVIGRFKVSRSIVPTGEVPEPIENWIDQAEGLLGELEGVIPEGGTTNQVLAKKSDSNYDLKWMDQTGGGGGGTTNYNDLNNKPQIAGTTLSGNKSLSSLGIASASDVENLQTDVNGKIDAPQSASAGDFLCYNGSAWVATTLSTWQGGSY